MVPASHARVRPRCALTALAATAVAGGLLALATSSLVALGAERLPRARRLGWWAALDTAPLADLLTGLAAAALAVATAWLWGGTMLTLGRIARHGTRSRPVRALPGRLPRCLGRALAAACGVAVVGTVAVPAAAVPTPLHEEPRRVPAAAAPPVSAPPVAGTWTVRRGDTVWALARAGLARAGHPDASNARIAARVEAVAALNAGAVPDPDLILPGQVLRVPPIT